MALLKSKSAVPSVNLLDLKPVRNYKWERIEGERVAVLVPKFGYPRLLRFISPRLAESTFRVKLDDFGSFVWHLCDGQTTVAEISEKLKARFGEAVEPVYERVGRFIQKLARDEYVSVTVNGKSVP